MNNVSRNDLMLVSGLTEVTLGALTGWPYAVAISDPDKIRAIGIKSVPRLRQWHLDLIALGSLTVLVAASVPDLPRRVAWPLSIGAWTNAHSFGVLMIWPDAKDHPVYRTAIVGSFTAVTWGWVSLLRLVVGRKLGRRGRG